jgi:hypothetical protein
LKKAFASKETKEDFCEDIKALLFEGLIDKEKSISADIYNFIEQAFEITDNIYDAIEKVTRYVFHLIFFLLNICH